MATGRRDFLSMEAPANYVAGLGRGATGFTTRSDIGPAKEGPSEEAIKAALARREAAIAAGEVDDDDEDRFKDPESADIGLFSSAPYDADDQEADNIYAAVDEKLARRTQKQREAREAEEREQERKEGLGGIQNQFADLKRGLAMVTDEEWAALPDATDATGKNRKARQKLRERFYAVSDSVIASARDSTGLDTSVSAEAPAPADSADGAMTNFVEIGAARDKVLSLKLDQAGAESVASGLSSTIDPKGYLTGLGNLQLKSDAEIGDIKKARLLLKSVISTNPKHAPGWIAAARLEELAGKQVQARNLIAQGCELCPTNEDIWLEAVRLNTEENAKVILAEAVSHIPRSVKLWMKAMQLEKEVLPKKRVLRKALELIPQSVKLWKEAVNLEENPADARILLARATELIPLSVELWLALARLETYENARKVLNKARLAVKTSHEIWLAAARLEEQNNNHERVEMIIKRAIMELQKEGAALEREQWLAEAEKCDSEGDVVTAQAIVNQTLGQGLEDEDREAQWMDDATALVSRGRFATARAVYAYALRVYPEEDSLWRKAAELEKNHGTREAMEAILEKGVEACPQAEVLWLMYAKERWLAGDVDSARNILVRAFEQNPNDEDIWLAAVKLEAENMEVERARILLERARREAGTERVWKKSVVFERQVGNAEAALDLVTQALSEFPTFDKLWMMKGQIYEDEGKIPQAREAYSAGCRVVPKSVPLWILHARLEENAGMVIKARAILDRARLAVPKDDKLWCESVRIELRANNAHQAKALMAKALQECPASGLLWTEAISLEPRSQRKTRSVDALRKCEGDPVLITTVARLFWMERKLDKARTWFDRALKAAESDYGDGFAWWYKFELQHGTEEQRQAVITRCVAVEPHHGEVWQMVAKQPKNAGKSVEEILKLVAETLE
ncbi:hypothetical protein SAICODRAFT_97686 [Saitoella complicata NRRL Y-17804]|uniref:Uncharacterized protein n=1 Tax=Saitoella complicata (strain BCRC 22490 / CBS 7301 / JCM 7358 / NBRC 10748 / NRRL Y-17804) TaxID=698492 RepID=A0A0E9NJS6_SAICN|nr:uncharacterized protein SAICODRAFT_97686 [Saitoella complicata NRRL Y-17804]ODQ50162.1 hypothetical protein SAICODRAFT_97686 [Saitoella complicata NRRL Y-17804]GAO49931.1 hypothetical protein G7K_4067-t1 [Saitoella complicata NRRL Y-17804]